jgi:hypothetical protein
MTLVVLTDLCSNSIMLSFTSERDQMAVLKYADVSLSQMALFIRD